MGSIDSYEIAFRHYMNEISEIPLLDKEEERKLVLRWQEYQDEEAYHRLVTSHIRLVQKIASDYRNSDHPFEDLVSIGCIGLMKAVRRFDLNRGCRLATPAQYWIREAIRKHIRENFHIIRGPRRNSSLTLFYRLRMCKAKRGITSVLNEEQAGEVAKELGLRMHVKDIIAVDCLLSYRPVSLNAPVGDGDGATEFQDTFPSKESSTEEVLCEKEELRVRSRVLHEAIEEELDPREKDIFMGYYLSEDVTLRVLADKHGVCRERIRQIKEKARDKVERAVLRKMKDIEFKAQVRRVEGVHAEAFRVYAGV